MTQSPYQSKFDAVLVKAKNIQKGQCVYIDTFRYAQAKFYRVRKIDAGQAGTVRIHTYSNKAAWADIPPDKDLYVIKEEKHKKNPNVIQFGEGFTLLPQPKAAITVKRTADSIKIIAAGPNGEINLHVQINEQGFPIVEVGFGAREQGCFWLYDNQITPEPPQDVGSASLITVTIKNGTNSNEPPAR